MEIIKYKKNDLYPKAQVKNLIKKNMKFYKMLPK